MKIPFITDAINKKNIKKKNSKIRYNAYMIIVNNWIKETKSHNEKLPEYERISKMTFKEWKDWQNTQ